MKLETLIKKGKFEYVNSDISSDNFPLEEVRSTDYKTFSFGREVSSEEVIEEMEKEGYAPANAYELLSWPDWNGKDWVVGLGSVARFGGVRNVLILGGRVGKRELNLNWCDGGWSGRYLFLGVRTLSLETQNSELSLSEPLTLPIEIETITINGVLYKRA